MERTFEAWSREFPEHVMPRDQWLTAYRRELEQHLEKRGMNASNLDRTIALIAEDVHAHPQGMVLLAPLFSKLDFANPAAGMFLVDVLRWIAEQPEDSQYQLRTMAQAAARALTYVQGEVVAKRLLDIVRDERIASRIKTCFGDVRDAETSLESIARGARCRCDHDAPPYRDPRAEPDMQVGPGATTKQSEDVGRHTIRCEAVCTRCGAIWDVAAEHDWDRVWYRWKRVR